MQLFKKLVRSTSLAQSVLIVALLGLTLSCNRNKSEQKLQAEYNSLSAEDKLKPEFAVAGLQTAPDVEVTLFASEPMLTNPTNMDIDAKGRVWVCEGFNYRNQLNPLNPYKKAGDRILILDEIGRASCRERV